MGMDKNTRMEKGQYKTIAVAFVCLLLVISPFAAAEEIASNTKDDINTSVGKSDEVEWQVVWQDETGTASVENGEPELFWFVVIGAITVYCAYDDVKNGDYGSVALSVTPIGKISKAAKVLNSLKKWKWISGKNMIIKGYKVRIDVETFTGPHIHINDAKLYFSSIDDLNNMLSHSLRGNSEIIKAAKKALTQTA